MSRIRPKAFDGIWYAYGTFDGKRVRKSLGTRDEQVAKEQCAIYEAKLWKRRAYGEEAVRTFEDAALSYMEQGGESRYLAPIIRYFKGRTLGTINPAEVREMAIRLYPSALPSTRNRHAIVPARAVINHGHDRGWCAPMKVKAFEVPKSRKHKPVDDGWMERFVAEADRSGLPHLSACVMFMQQTGARVSEAINVLGQHVNVDERIAWLEKTKTDEWSPRGLSAELLARMMALGLNDGERVFGYTDRQAVNRRIKAVCKRAGIELRSSHAVGRHTFATTVLKAGVGIKDAMDAGGWKSAALFMETYVHSHEAGKKVAAVFDRKSGPIDVNEYERPSKRRSHFGRRPKG